MSYRCDASSGTSFGATSTKDELNQNKEKITCQDMFSWLQDWYES